MICKTGAGGGNTEISLRSMPNEYLNAFHDSFGEWFFPVLLSRSVCDVIVEFVNGVSAEVTVRLICVTSETNKQTQTKMGQSMMQMKSDR